MEVIHITNKPKNEKAFTVRELLWQYESCAIILISSYGMGLLISVLLSIPFGLVIGHSSDLANFFSGIIATVVTIFILSCRDGYHTHKFKFSKLLLSVILAFLTQCLLVFIIGHAVWFSGPTVYLASYLLDTTKSSVINLKETLEIYRWILMLIAFVFVYAPLMFLGEYVGTKKHQRDFNKK